MCRSSRIVIPGFFIVALSLLIVPPAQSRGNPFSKQTAQHDTLLNAIGDLQESVDQLQPAPPEPACGAGTADTRFVLVNSDTRVCDNNSGIVWGQTPDTTPHTHASAIAHCQGLGGDLPEVQQLQSVVGYENVNPALPTMHPFTIPPVDGTVTSIGYWARTLFAGNPSSVGWAIAFIDGDVDMVSLSRSNIRAWCIFP